MAKKEYNPYKNMGGVYKKGREKGQKEVIDSIKKLTKADSESFNFETISQKLDSIESTMKNILTRIETIEKKLGIAVEQTQ
jgi:hypothetical protein